MRWQNHKYSLPRSVALALTGVVTLVAVLASNSQWIHARSVATLPPDGQITGPARIVDGDTIDIAGTRIRLEGIDAPEAGQTCETAKSELWECGDLATKTLRTMTAQRDVTCVSRGLDKYGRLLGICYVEGVDINAQMVERGLAWAFVKYSKIYVAHEARAQTAGIGIWQGRAQPAWDYRRRRWDQVAEASPEGCAIKGNVSRAGLIYHMPWNPWYQKVNMSPDKGTRWFCSEDEALAAGWRAAKAP
jgi:endonuclease YncB( thermonuclease family)